LDDAPESDKHLTSARDVAIMSRELINNHPDVFKYSTIWMDTIRNGAFGLTNTNRLIRFYRGATGLKTGSTSKAGFCISATAERDGMSLIAVVMASPTRDIRNEAAKTLLDYGFANFCVYSTEGGSAGLIPVTGGVAPTAEAHYDKFSVVLPKGKDKNVVEEIKLNESVAAPVNEGDEVGVVTYTLDGEVIGTVPITAANSVAKIGYGGLLLRLIRSFLLN
ncbi:MAG TPA: D-alanyl-D-alanine carboxypeptidase, partial [Bacillota bacterium]|nr:D-alanyl-D-alanine carboxypeptidase [Bacillota bacterium]